MTTADSGIQKAIIKKENLPTLNANNGYSIRYRIVDEDGSRTSHWSQKYFLISNTVEKVQATIVVDSANSIITIYWDSPLDKTIKNFDIYVKWSNSLTWQYYSTVATNTYSVRSIPSGSTSIQFAIQVPTDPKVRIENATLYETATPRNL